MISLGYTAREMNQLRALLVDHHRISMQVQLLTLDHKYVADITRRLLGGQVTIDADANESTRSCNLEILDPAHQLKLDSDSPEDGSIYATRMIKVIYSVIAPDRSARFDIPIFCGPLNKVDRSGVVLMVEALGKETLSMSSVWKGRDFKKGMKKTEVIQILMSEFGGERRLDLADSNQRTPNKIALNRNHNAWGMAKSLARSMDMQLFYDGRGVCRLRPLPAKTIYVFRQNGSLLTMPQAGYDMSAAINAVQVIGGKPKGSKTKITHREVAAKTHPLSPWTLGRWGTPRYLPETIEDDSIKSQKNAVAIAKTRLKNRLIMAVEVSFDSLPIPFLEELDLCRVQSDEFSGSFRIRKMVIPLTADGTSSIGYLKRATPKRRPIKNRSKKKGKGKK